MSIDTDANALFAALTTDLNITIPDIDLTLPVLQVPTILSDEMYEHISGPEIIDLTTRTVGGAGAFDALMASTSAHLKAEFDKNRITGADYTKAYIELTQISMQMAVQFALGKDQAFWQSQQAQIAAISGRVQLEMNKLALAKARIEAVTAEVTYATAKAQMATASVQYDIAKYNLSTVLPGQVALTAAQVVMISKQILLLAEQTEVQRAQTLDTRSDGSAVQGTLGKQKELYQQQITSYQRDAEVKAAKLFTDAFITMKTVDDGLIPPGGFTNASLDPILTHIKANNGFT